MKNKLLCISVLFSSLIFSGLATQNYHEDDKEGLRMLLRQKSSSLDRLNLEILGLTTADTMNWYTDEQWIDKMMPFIAPVPLLVWNNDSPKRIKYMWIYNIPSAPYKLAGLLDCSKFQQLIDLNCSDNGLELDISQNIELGNLSCSNNKLTELNIMNNINLASVSCSNNLLTTLDISNNHKLGIMDCSRNRLYTFIYSDKILGLNHLSLEYNNFKFSTLPDRNVFPYYSMYEQAPIDLGEICTGDIIDISSEYTIRGTISSYDWFDENGNAVELQNLGGGKFIAWNELSGKRLTCQMENELFPSLTLAYNVTIVAKSFMLTDHLSIVETPAPDYYVSSPGETFQVYAQANIDPGQVRIGLFKTTGVFIEDITQSRSNHVYTCRISDHVASGNYMIQPCDIAADQTIRLIERKEGSNLIDKLPFAFSNTRWSLNGNGIMLSSHLVLNTSEKNLYKAFIDNTFRVVVNAPITAYTRIGLFDVYGELVEDITQSVTGKLFTCNISYNVFPDNYMIMAYEETTTINLIERNPGAVVMDKLPLAVDYDWSRRVVTPKSSEGQVGSGIFENIQFYPNPVQDMLYIRSSGPIVSVCVYDLNGRLVKEAGEVNQISLGNLQAGTYLLKIQTTEREIIGKVRKN